MMIKNIICLLNGGFILDYRLKLNKCWAILFVSVSLLTLYSSKTFGQSSEQQAVTSLSTEVEQKLITQSNEYQQLTNSGEAFFPQTSPLAPLPKDRLLPQDFENLNIFSGRISFNFPLLKVSGRGENTFPIALKLGSSWKVRNVFDYNGNGGDQDWMIRVGWSSTGTVTHAGGTAGQTTKYVGGMMQARNEVINSGTLLYPKAYIPNVPCDRCTSPYGYTKYANGLTRTTLIYEAPDGRIFELVDELTMGKPLIPSGSPLCDLPGPNRGKIFVTRDGSNATFISDEDIYDVGYLTGTAINFLTQRPGYAWESPPLNGYIKFSDGTVARIENWRTIWIQDRNGNKITFQYDPQISYATEATPNIASFEDVFPFGRVTKIIDSNGREIVFSYGIDEPNSQYGYHDKITYKGFGGQTREIRVTHKFLGDSLKAGEYLKKNKELFFVQDSPTPEIIKTYGEFYNGVSLDDREIVFNPVVPSVVWLADGRNQKIYYHNTGEVARIELMTGGAVEYDYANGEMQGESGGDPEPSVAKSSPFVYRRLIEKRLFTDLTNNWVSKTTISQPKGIDSANNQYIEQTEYEVGNQVLSKQKIFNYGRAGFSLAPKDLSFPSWKEGKNYKSEFLDTSSNLVLRREEKIWKQKGIDENSTRGINDWWYVTPRAYAVWRSLYNSSGTTSYLPETSDYMLCCGSPSPRWITGNPFWDGREENEPASDPRIIESKLTIEPEGANLVSKKTFKYDWYNNITDVYEYDYNIGEPGQFLRRTHIDYLTDTNYTSYTGAHLRSLPLQKWISSDINGNSRASLTQFEYDNYTIDTNHAALVSRINVSGFDSANFGTGFTRRGNLTAVTSYTDAQNQTGAISVYSQYDILGNVVKAIDAKSNALTISYNDKFGSPDAEAQTNSAPSQLNGQSTFAFPTSATNPLDWVTYIQFDYHTGQPVDVEDVNGVVSSSIYNDALDRLTQTIISNNFSEFRQQTTIIYDDINRKVTTTSDLFGFGDNLAKSEAFYDGLGRTIEQRKYETGGYTAIKTIYDALSRIEKVSNPYRPFLNETELWTIRRYDALSRIKEVETPDGAKVLTDYSGNTITVTDQAGKKRRSINNAAGWLMRVDEPNEAGQLDVNGTPVQPTNYSYNVLSNLVQVQQIGTNTQQCGGSTSNCSQTRTFVYDSISRLKQATNPESGTIQYQYDNNGNLTEKTDARNVVTTYTYDALNRLLTRSYSGESGYTTPAVTYTYDDVVIPNSKGRLTKVSSSVSSTEYLGFDLLGRVLAHRQMTDGTAYTTAYNYYLSGALKEETYPSGRIVKNILDNDGDLSAVQSKKNQNYGFWNYAHHFTYTASGAVSSMQIGNGHWESTQFNTRLQPTQIALGTVQNGFDKLKLNYDYGTTTNNGNVQSQTITVPSGSGANGFTATQTYSYDSLNRLKEATEIITGTGQSWKQTFLYDRYGNRRFDQSNTTVPSSFTNVTNPQIEPSNNRLIGYQFDNTGNITTDADGWTFIYEAENKQIEVKNSQTQTIGQYWYDGEGKRVKKKGWINNQWEETVFVYDAMGRLVAEYSNQTPGNQVSYLTTDHLGSPRILTDVNGNVISRRDFHPFGEEIFTAQRTQGLGYTDDAVRQSFTSYERDEETDLDFAQARMYANRLGRFTTTDPLFFQDDRLVFPQKFNLYAYASNNPLKYIDPDGLEVVVTGEGKDKRVEDINNRDGGKFKVELGANGVLKIVDEDKLDVSKLDAREKALYDAIKDPNNRATLKGVAATDDFQYGAYGPFAGENAGTNLVDNGDLELLRNQSRSAAAEVVLHEVMEAYAAAKDKQGGTVQERYNRHHAEANQFTGNVQNVAGDGNPAKITPILATQNPQTFSGAHETVQIKTPTQTIRWDQTIVFKQNLTLQQLTPWPPKATITVIKNKQVIK